MPREPMMCKETRIMSQSETPIVRESKRFGNLQDLLDEIRRSGKNPEKISVADIREQLGSRSFGPLLLIGALPPLTPVSTVPGVPSLVGIITTLTAGQMVLGMRSVWLPRTILERSLERSTVDKVTSRLMPIARFIDRLSRPRLTSLTYRPFSYGVALCCLALGILMLPLEILPFTSGIPAFPVAVFGLSIITRDGAVAIFGFISSLLAVVIIIFIFILGSEALSALL